VNLKAWRLHLFLLNAASTWHCVTYHQVDISGTTLSIHIVNLQMYRSCFTACYFRHRFCFIVCKKSVLHMLNGCASKNGCYWFAKCCWHNSTTIFVANKQVQLQHVLVCVYGFVFTLEMPFLAGYYTLVVCPRAGETT